MVNKFDPNKGMLQISSSRMSTIQDWSVPKEGKVSRVSKEAYCKIMDLTWSYTMGEQIYGSTAVHRNFV